MNKNTVIISLLLLITLKSDAQDTVLQIVYNPIGIFHTEFTPKTGAPRQGILIPETKGQIEIYPKYRSALSSLCLFEYIIVIFHFSEVESWQPTVNPPEANHEHNFGLFSTRSPKRPNSIGFSVVKLENIKDGILYISGVDAFDGTPVLDIKPYLPSIDCIKSYQNEFIEKELGHHDQNFIKDSTYFK
ncbi:MAG: tRNA (N6-threonylcarbamoyladenosine(37)-N6)-methyltransferase TrmO [Bacteroidota bacterium]|nr:tRNA (N6-threonylcarbamoyladenosine(37)-N6)-methyltransferase TrmO [Bacteroidota bacterium]